MAEREGFRMMLRVAALAAGLAAAPAWGQDDLAERKAVASEYLMLQLETMDLDALVAQMARMVLGEIETRQPTLYAEKQARLRDIVARAMAQSLRDGMIGLDGDAAETFSLAELTALRDFYASPDGLSVMRKMPAFMAAAMPRIMQATMANSGTLMQDLAAEGVLLQ